MKIALILAFLSISCLIITSCNKNDSTAPISFSATVSGAPFSTTNVTESAPAGIYDFAASGSNANISLYLTGVSTGTYTLTTSNPGIGYVGGGKSYANGTSSKHIVSKGSIIITANSNSTISGTFTGTLYNLSNGNDSVVITNGQFSNLLYQ